MDPYCEGDRIALFGESTDSLKYPDIMYQWFPMDGQIQDSTNTGNVVIILKDTTEFFRIMNNNGCHDTTSVVINVIPFNVPLSVTDTTLCDGEEFQVIVQDPEVTDIEWTPADGLSCTTCPDPFVMVMNSVTYMMMGMKSGCPVGGELNVTVPGPLQILIGDTSACPGQMIAFNIDTSGLSNLHISTTNNAPLSCTDCPNPIVTYLGGVVQLIVEADENLEQFCGATGTATIFPSSGDVPQFMLGGNPPYGQGESAPITLVTIPPASDTTTYSWTVNNDLLPESSATVNAVLDEQSNTILVEWINSQGCLQTFDTIIPTGPPGYKIPKAFTPGNTMTNTHFRVQIEGNLELTEMLVFNRWGQVVYDGTDLQGWDGRHDGEPAPPGVYAYLIKLRYPDGDVILEKGDVTLLR
jgi:gliding motility-associated-like protein